MLTAPYNSTGNFRLPIPVSDWLIFYHGDLIFYQKKNENNKNTNFMTKKNKKGQKAFFILNLPH